MRASELQTKTLVDAHRISTILTDMRFYHSATLVSAMQFPQIYFMCIEGSLK